MFLFDAQMAMMRAWTEAGQTGLRMMTGQPMAPWTMPFGNPWTTNPWTTNPWASNPWAANPWSSNPWAAMGNPWSFGAAWTQPFVAAPFWGAAAQPMLGSMWGWPFMTAPMPMLPLGTPPAFAAMMQMPLAWSAAAAEIWSPRTPPAATWPATSTPSASSSSSYRSAGGHATATIVTPVDLARSLANFWTTDPSPTGKLH